MFGIIISNSSKKRDQLIKHLNSKKIGTRTFFCPLTHQPFLKKIKGYNKYKCKISENMWKQGLYLPSANNLKEKEISYISEAIKEFFS